MFADVKIDKFFDLIENLGFLERGIEKVAFDELLFDSWGTEGGVVMKT